MMNVTIKRLKKRKMKEIQFESWLTCELFDYLMDNYVIPDDSKFEDWMHFRPDMLVLAEEFHENHIESIEEWEK